MNTSVLMCGSFFAFLMVSIVVLSVDWRPMNALKTSDNSTSRNGACTFRYSVEFDAIEGGTLVEKSKPSATNPHAEMPMATKRRMTTSAMVRREEDMWIEYRPQAEGQRPKCIQIKNGDPVPDF